MKKKLFIFLALILLISGITYADTDGVWTLAKNIRGGTFGSDEQPVTFNYSFINPVFMNRTLTINTSLGRGLWSESNASDGVAGVTSAKGYSAIYGLAKNPASYSGYFEGGNFIVANGNVGIGTATPTAKLDVNGNISAGNIYSNGNLVATQSWTNSQLSSLQSSGSLVNSQICPTYSGVQSYVVGINSSGGILCSSGSGSIQFKNPGTYKFQVPFVSSVANTLHIRMIGGGGAGSPGQTSGQSYDGVAGHPGTYFDNNYNIPAGTTLTIVVGKGAQGSTSSGGSGQSTTISWGNSVLTAKGGAGAGLTNDGSVYWTTNSNNWYLTSSNSFSNSISYGNSIYSSWYGITTSGTDGANNCIAGTNGIYGGAGGGGPGTSTYQAAGSVSCNPVYTSNAAGSGGSGYVNISWS